MVYIPLGVYPIFNGDEIRALPEHRVIQPDVILQQEEEYLQKKYQPFDFDFEKDECCETSRASGKIEKATRDVE